MPAQLKVAISVGIGLFIALIGFVDAGFVRRIPDAAQTTVPVQLGQAASCRLAGAGLRVGLAWSSSPVGAPGQGRDPDLDHRHHAARDRRRGDRRLRLEQRREPKGWSLNVPTWPTGRLRQARLRHARRVLAARLLRVGRRRHRRAAGLHADARRLLRHDGHDDRHRRRGRPARRGGHPPNTQRILVVDSLAAAAGGAARRLVEHLLHRVRLRCRRGRPHRPRLGRHRRCCSCSSIVLRAAGRRSSRPRRPSPRWSWSAS